jgi:hypothetical protein
MAARQAKIHQHAAPFGTALLQAAADARLRIRRVQESIDASLRSDTFDIVAVDALAHRFSYADAASYLLRIVRAGPELIPALVVSSTFAPYRFAIIFRVIPSEAETMQPFTLDALRTIDTPQARLAMIACGEPVDWKTADKIQRTVFALRHLVTTMRNR